MNGFPRVFQGIFEVLAGVTEELKYSLLMHLVQSQCYYSYQLCVDGFPHLF